MPIQGQYIYSDRTLDTWDAPAAAAALWERANHLQERVTYWERRARSAEARMLAHNCQEEQ
ncbi:hypothetical protein [Pseudarthrobacter oxydans]|uniref:hypothetical protein n=1 Tax=Pseudarthrobacter oxydans TaxID=1671 RepID=UPI003450DC6C